VPDIDQTAQHIVIPPGAFDKRSENIMLTTQREDLHDGYSILTLSYTGQITGSDLDHASVMLQRFIRSNPTRAYVVIDVSGVSAQNTEMIPTLMRETTATAQQAAMPALVLLVSGTGAVQRYLDYLRQDARGATALPVVPLLRQALAAMRLLISRDAYKRQIRRAA
jgi:hypothetical protein